MDAQEVRCLTYGDEDMAESLAAAGVRLPAARVLVFLARFADATAGEIRKGTDQSYPAVSLALRQLVEQGWVACHGKKPDAQKGLRFILAWPFDAIVSSIGDEVESGGPAWIMTERGSRFV